MPSNGGVGVEAPRSRYGRRHRAVFGVGSCQGHRAVPGPPYRIGLGSQTMAVMEKEPKRLLEIEGIGAKKLAVITESFYEEKQVNDLALDLETHGVSGRYAARLVQKYGEEACMC